MVSLMKATILFSPFVCNRSLDSIVNFPYTYCKISLHFYNYLILATFSKPIF